MPLVRLVLDTNTVISSLLWNGPPRRLLDAALGGTAELYTSAVLVAALREVLAYPRLAKRLTANGESVDRCVARYLAIATLTATATIEGIVTADPDDDHVIGCALSRLTPMPSFREMGICSISNSIGTFASSLPRRRSRLSAVF